MNLNNYLEITFGGLLFAPSSDKLLKINVMLLCFGSFNWLNMINNMKSFFWGSMYSLNKRNSAHDF
jgi:hypothetical protein